MSSFDQAVRDLPATLASHGEDHIIVALQEWLNRHDLHVNELTQDQWQAIRPLLAEWDLGPLRRTLLKPWEE